jgi:hypothetical protein
MNPPVRLSRSVEGMDWVWILAAMFTAWAVLRVIGAERQRRLQELLIQIALEQAEAPSRAQKLGPSAMPATPPPVRSKAAR